MRGILIRSIGFAALALTACTPAQQQQLMRSMQAVEKPANAGGEKTATSAKKGPAKQAAAAAEMKPAAPWPDGPEYEIWLPPGNGFNERQLGVPHSPTTLATLAVVPSSRPDSDRLETSINTCKYQSEVVRSRLEQSLLASMFWASGGASNASDERILRYAATCSRKSVKLQRSVAIDQSTKALVPVEIIYGWTYREFIRASRDLITAEMEAQFASLGLEAKSRFSKDELTSYIDAIGLADKNPQTLNLIRDSRSAEQRLKPKNGGQGEPILVRYLLVGGMKRDSLDRLSVSSKPRLRAGMYQVSFDLKLAPGNPTCKGCSELTAPDPHIRLDMPAATAPVECHKDNTRALKCDLRLKLRTVSAKKGGGHTAKVTVGDLAEKHVWFTCQKNHDELFPDVPIECESKGNIERLTMKFVRLPGG